MQRLLGALFALMVSTAAIAQPVNTGHLTAELVPAAQAIVPGQTLQIALRQQIQPGGRRQVILVASPLSPALRQ